jgi:ABC-type multidrug transport system permease subunit
MRSVVFLARKDLGHMFRAWETWLWAFLMPLVFFYFIGTISGGAHSPAARQTLAVVVPPDAGFLAEQLEGKLQRHYQVVRTPEDAAARFRRSLRLPAGFTGQVLAGKPVKVTLRLSEEGMGGEYDRFRVSRAVYTLLADLIVASRGGSVPQAEALAEVQRRPRSLALSVESAGPQRRPPAGFEQAVPGTMVMFLLLVMLTTGGVWLVIERNQGILARLAAAPLSRGTIVAGKCAARWILGLVQMAFAMLAGALLFGVHWGRNWPAIVLLLALYAGLWAMLSLLLGSLARTEQQVVGLGVIAANVLAALGGCWWPIEITPLWAQKLALLFPTGWAMDALHKLVSFGEPAGAILPHLAAILTAALAAGWAASRRFRFQ